MKRLTFIALMMFCSVSWADWEYAAKSSNSQITHYVDTSTIRKNGEVVRMWTMTDYGKTQDGIGKENYNSEGVMFAFDCKSETSAVVSRMLFSGAMGGGTVVFSHTQRERLLNYDPIFPGSVAQVYWKLACNK
jgi:hypothetical protein